MKEIKSVKAISKINDLKEEYNPAVILDIIDIVELAEQDAEVRFSKDKVELVDRMFSIFVDEIRQHFPYMDLLQIVGKARQRIAMEINNGGQSHE